MLIFSLVTSCRHFLFNVFFRIFQFSCSLIIFLFRILLLVYQFSGAGFVSLLFSLCFILILFCCFHFCLSSYPLFYFFFLCVFFFLTFVVELCYFRFTFLLQQSLSFFTPRNFSFIMLY